MLGFKKISTFNELATEARSRLMPYLLDANIFIQAKNLHYSFDFCPAFWEWLDASEQDGKRLQHREGPG